MSFGRNPHVAKAEAAELKANDASDEIAREQAWREASRLWERAAEREKDEKRRKLYEANAERAREQADAPQHEGDEAASANASDTSGASGANGASEVEREPAREPTLDRARSKLLN